MSVPPYRPALRYGSGEGARRRRAAAAAMTPVQRITGKTVAELDAEQARLRADAARRRAAKT